MAYAARTGYTRSRRAGLDHCRGHRGDASRQRAAHVNLVTAVRARIGRFFMLTIKRAITRAVFLVLVAGLAAAADDAADAARLIEVLGIHAGASVADIGAGDGVLTIPIAHTV